MKTSLYWIRHKDHTDMFSQGYVGVSTNTDARFERHKRHSENPHLKAAITKYGWGNLVKQILVVGEEDYCYRLESALRPTRQIGWNIAEGGDKPPISQSRGVGYVSPLKGKSKSTPWMFGRKPWNTGLQGYWSEEHKAQFLDMVSKPHSEDHIAKRQASRRATRLARGQIKSVVVNNTVYEDSKIASEALGIPEATIKYWCYGKGKPGKKYEHIKECRWA